MALSLQDRVRESSATTGTGTISLAGAYVGFVTFASSVSDGDTVYYTIHNTETGFETEWEVGIGTFTLSGETLSRDTILSSSNAGSAVNFSAGTKEVFITQPASKAVFEDASDNVTVGGKITVGAGPTADLEVATKQYVDNATAAALHYHDPVRVESPVALTAAYDNGTSGVGATLTNSGTQAALVIDGITMATSDRVLVYQQTNAAHNGVYTVTDIGSGSTNWVLTRASDADTYNPSDPDAMGQGDAFYVQEGDTGAGESYVLTTQGTIIFGTTEINYSQFAATPALTGGTNIDVTGQTISLTGTVAETNGGTGTATYTLGDILYSNASNSLAKLAGNTDATAKYLTQTGTGSVSAAPTWTALAASATTDTTDASNISSGTLPSGRLSGSYTGVTGVGTLTAGTWTASTIGAAYGGTGLTSYTVGDIVYADGTTSLAKLSGVATGNALISGGVGAAPSYGKIGLTTHVSGILPIANGGTGSNTSNGAINALLPSQTGNSGKYLTTNGSTTSWGLSATDANTASTIVARDASGDFSAGTITAGGLEVNGGTTNRVASFISTDANAFIEFADDSTTNRPAVGAEGDDLTLTTNGEKMRIDSDGNVGIGTTSPDEKLDVAGTVLISSANSFKVTGSDSTSSQAVFRAYRGGAGDQTGSYAGFRTVGDGANGVAAFLFDVDSAEAMRISAAGGLSVGTTADPGAGAIYATGNITAHYSDDRLKTKLGSIENALDKIEALSGFYYEANETAQELGYEVKREVGVSAQEVQAVMPEVVAPAPIDDQYLTVRYERLVPLLIEAIKELRAEVKALKGE